MGYRYVDGFISMVGGTQSAGEMILMKYMPMPTTPPVTLLHGGGGGGGAPAVVYPPVPPPAPPVVNPTAATMVARWPGNVPLTTQGTMYSTSGSVYAAFAEPAPDPATLAAAKAQGLEQRVYYSMSSTRNGWRWQVIPRRMALSW